MTDLDTTPVVDTPADTTTPSPGDPANAGAPPQDAGNPGTNSGEQQGQTDDTAGTPAGAPETYQWNVPEGTSLDTEVLGEFEAVAREFNLTNDNANRLIPMAQKLLEKQAAASAEVWQNQVAEWGKAAKADPEIGGSKFDANISAAQAALAKYGTPALKADLEKFGFGNHPELMRLLARVGHAMSEKPLAKGTQDAHEETLEEKGRRMFSRSLGGNAT